MGVTFASPLLALQILTWESEWAETGIGLFTGAITFIAIVLLLHVVALAPRRQRDEERSARRRLEAERIEQEDKLLLGLAFVGPEILFRTRSDDPALLDATVGVKLRNTSAGPIRYEVESMTVVIAGKTNPEPVFVSRGGLLTPGETTTFSYALIRDLDETSDIYVGVAEYVAKYGHPLGPWQYRSRRRFQFTVNHLVGNERHTYVEHLMIEESEERMPAPNREAP